VQVAGDRELIERAQDRPEYPAMVTQFVALAADFGETIPEEAIGDLERLAASIECIDRTVDGIADDAHRGAAWARVLDVLEADDATPARNELDRASLELRDLAVSRGVLARVARIMRKESRVAETMRRTEDERTYVGCTLREGRLGAALTLVLVGGTPPFRRFFYRLGGPANVIDKLVDVRADHAAGEIRVRPRPAVYARLVVALLRHIPVLLASHPGWGRILCMGVRWLRLLGTSPERLGRP
jgi:hypothetical protein